MSRSQRPSVYARLKKAPAFRWLGRNAILLFDVFAIRIKRFRVSDTIVISGSPRTGTTLVMEMVGWLPGYASIFEPLHPKWYRGAKAAGFSEKPFVPEGAEWSVGDRYLGDVLSGRIIGRTYYFNTTLRHAWHRLRARRLVVKFVRASQILPWIDQRFATRATIFIVRHPCAVISSQLKSRFTGYILPDREGDYLPGAEELRREAARLETQHPGVLEKVEDLSRPEEILAAIWCLDMLVSLSSTRIDSWYVLPYERLLADQEREVERLFDWLGEPVPARAREQLRRPTQVVRDERIGKVIESRAQLPKWKKTLEPDQIRAILSVVSRFGLDFYGEDPEPDLDALRSYVHARRLAR